MIKYNFFNYLDKNSMEKILHNVQFCDFACNKIILMDIVCHLLNLKKYLQQKHKMPRRNNIY